MEKVYQRNGKRASKAYEMAQKHERTAVCVKTGKVLQDWRYMGCMTWGQLSIIFFLIQMVLMISDVLAITKRSWLQGPMTSSDSHADKKKS